MSENAVMMGRHRTAVIAGVGLTEVGKVYGRSAPSFAAEAVRRAVTDAGLDLCDVDGLLVNAGKSSGLDVTLARRLGLRDLRMLCEVNAFGTSTPARSCTRATVRSVSPDSRSG